MSDADVNSARLEDAADQSGQEAGGEQAAERHHSAANEGPQRAKRPRVGLNCLG